MKIDKQKCCGNCKYHVHEPIDDGWVCVNSESTRCADWTDNEYTCCHWEGKE